MLFRIALLTGVLFQALFPAGPLRSIAVLDFQGNGVSPELSRTVRDLVELELIKLERHRVVERSRLSSVLKEQGLQDLGCVEGACAIRIGKLVSAELLVTGTVARLGNDLLIMARLTSVETGDLSAAVRATASSEEALVESVTRLCRELAGLKDAEPAVKPNPHPPAAHLTPTPTPEGSNSMHRDDPGALFRGMLERVTQDMGWRIRSSISNAVAVSQAHAESNLQHALLQRTEWIKKRQQTMRDRSESASGNESNAISNREKHPISGGGEGGPEILYLLNPPDFTSLGDRGLRVQDAIFMGGRGVGIFPSGFRIGGAGYGLITLTKTGTNRLGIGLGGMVLGQQVRFWKMKLVIDVALGAGGYDISPDNHSQYSWMTSPKGAFFAAMPSVSLGIRPAPFLCILATGTYLFTLGNGSEPLRGFTAGLSFQFGGP